MPRDEINLICCFIQGYELLHQMEPYINQVTLKPWPLLHTISVVCLCNNLWPQLCNLDTQIVRFFPLVTPFGALLVLCATSTHVLFQFICRIFFGEFVELGQYYHIIFIRSHMLPDECVLIW
jgi:hypothetical protein